MTDRKRTRKLFDPADLPAESGSDGGPRSWSSISSRLLPIPLLRWLETCASVVKATSNLLRAGRKAGVPVIFTTVEYDPSLKDAGLFVRKVNGLKWLVTGSSWVALHPGLRRKKGS